MTSEQKTLLTEMIEAIQKNIEENQLTFDCRDRLRCWVYVASDNPSQCLGDDNGRNHFLASPADAVSRSYSEKALVKDELKRLREFNPALEITVQPLAKVVENFMAKQEESISELEAILETK